MLLVILAICIAAAVGGFVIHNKAELYSDWEFWGAFIGVLASMCVIVALVFIVITSYNVVNIPLIDEKIAMYQEENTKIEQEIGVIVENYQKYESETFANVKVDSPMVAISLYPELKSDTLVSSQIQTHVDNNNQIKHLKEQKIQSGMLRWWLYFGK